jgi:peptide/nickel transport system substrate-binding protein
MEIIKKQKRNEAHAYIPELEHLYQQGRISRRAFLRHATLLGMSLASASAFLAACGTTAAPTQVPTATPPPEPTQTPEPTATTAPAGPTRGGTLKIASRVHKLAHLAQISWANPTHQMMHVTQFLAVTDENNITHPDLLESWEPSEDLQTWKLNLRQGIQHNNGDEFVADDVIFTMREWLKEDVGSAQLGVMGGYLSPEDIERVDDYTVTLHLSRPELAVPEHLFGYAALVMNHRTFEGDFLRAPHGPGPYTLEDYTEGERVLLKRREGYWRDGADGQPLPYLDAMEWIDMGEEASAWIAAIRAGEVDLLDLGSAASPDHYQALKDRPDVTVAGVASARTRVLRMRVDVEPWTDNRVRQALKLCQDREKILQLAYFGEGVLGHDTHVYPGHPEYCEKPIPPYDPEQAKQLLVDAGYPDGLDVSVAVGTGWPDIVSYAEVLKEDAAPAGFNITVETMPNSKYWEVWDQVGLGITSWAHRPLGTMMFSIAYSSDEDGNPVPWNETKWVDPEFDELLAQASGTIDVEERRQIFCELEQIQMDRGSIGVAWWQNTWMIFLNKVMDVPAHPSGFTLLEKAWLKS